MRSLMTLLLIGAMTVMIPTAEAYQTQISMEPNNALRWNAMSETEKVIFIFRELEYYRQAGVDIQHSVYYYLKDVEGVKKNPWILGMPIREIILMSIVRNAEFETEEAFAPFIEMISVAHRKRQWSGYGSSFDDFAQEGTFRDYHYSGLCSEQWYFKDGKKIGDYLAFYPDGKLYLKLVYDDGVLEDYGMMYYPSGALKEIEFYEKGVLNGTRKKFYESGMIQGEVPFNNGQVAGVIRSYYEDGHLKQEAEYDEGQMTSLRTFTTQGEVVEETFDQTAKE